MTSAGEREAAFFSRQVKKASRFYRNTSSRADKRFHVAAGGIETCVPGYHIERSSFRFYGIEYVISGEGSLSMGGCEYRLHPGMMFCYGPGVAHKITANTEKGLTKCFMDVTGREASSLMNEHLHLPGSVLYISLSQKVVAGYEELIHYGLSASVYAQDICSSLGRALVLKMLHLAQAYGGHEEPSYVTYQHCREIIASGFLQMATLKDAASRCGVSPSYLCRLFKKHDHMTPYRYLQGLQMGYVADAMDRGGLRVGEAAQLLNYEDVHHFSRAFKRIMGVSPAAYKENPLRQEGGYTGRIRGD